MVTSKEQSLNETKRLTDETLKEASKDRGIDYIRTAALILSFTAYGLVSSMVYSTLPDFRHMLNCTAGELSLALSFGALGSLAAIPFGILADRYSDYSDICIGTSLVFAAVANILRPYGKSLIVFAICEFCDDIAWGTIENTANREIPRMWGGQGQSPMLAMHLGFPVAAAAGAHIASLFVARKIHRYGLNETSANGSLVYTNSSQSDIVINGTATYKTPDESDYMSHIDISFIIAGTYTFAVATVFFFLQCCRKMTKQDNTENNKASWRDIFKPSKWSNYGSAFGIKLLVFFVFYEIVLCGCMTSIGPFLTLFAVDSHLGFEPPEAARMNAIGIVADALFTFFCAICLSRYLSVKVMLMLEIHGLLLASVGALVLGTRYKTALYFFVCMFQIFKGPSYASIFSWFDHYINPLCTLLGVVRVIRNGFYILQVRLQGYLYDHETIDSIFYMAIAYSVAMSLSACLIYYVTHRIPYRYEMGQESSINADISPDKKEKLLPG